jgi:hypothetical protein
MTYLHIWTTTYYKPVCNECDALDETEQWDAEMNRRRKWLDATYESEQDAFLAMERHDADWHS